MTLLDPKAPDFWHTERPHEWDCPMAVALRKAAGRITPKVPCMDGCRHGEPWPTLRLTPADVKRVRETYGS